MGRTACTEPQCLYRASVPVQSLGACTEPRCLYRASVPVQSLSACREPRCLYRASVPVQSLGACTEPRYLYRASVPVQSLGACTEPQCLYKGALYLTFTFAPSSVRNLTLKFSLDKQNKTHCFSISKRRYERNVTRIGRKQQINICGKY